LWGYFVPVPPKAGTKRALERLYVHSGYEVRPVVDAILRHPALYDGPRMVKSPTLYIAGLLRSLGRGIDTEAWTWLSSLAGQQRQAGPGGSERGGEEAPVPAADRERAAAARLLRPRPPDLLMARSCHHCDEFSRASLLRRGAAEAGRGLPAIEPGMPSPAGT